MLELFLQGLASLARDGGMAFDVVNFLAGITGACETSDAYEEGWARAATQHYCVRAWNAEGPALVEYVESPERAEQRSIELACQFPEWTVIWEMTVL